MAIASLTTIRTGGPAARLVEVSSTDALIAAVSEADTAGEPILLIGGGSNLLVADNGFDGTVIHVRTRGVQIDGDQVTAAAGEPWDGFTAAMLDVGRGQLAPLSGIPGTVGATPIQNVGAYGTTVEQHLVSVTVFDRQDGQVREIAAAECGFGNRTSIFKRNPRFAVLAVTFRLPTTAKVPVRYPQLAEKLGVVVGEVAPTGEVREAVLELRRSKGMVLDADDHDTWSLGSFFVNPTVATVPEAAKECPTYPAEGGGSKLSAAWLIEQAGFGRGYSLGRAALSSKHTLAITNRGEASTTDVLELAAVIRDGVRERFGVALRPECDLVGCELPESRVELRRRRASERVARTDLTRAAVKLSTAGMSPREIAEQIGVTEPVVNSLLHRAELVGVEVTPAELILRAWLDGTPREPLLEALCGWSYTFATFAPRPAAERIPGTWDDVVFGHYRGQLSDAELERIFEAVDPPPPWNG